MTDKAEPGAGDVPLVLGDDELVLKPSLEACMQISKLAGNSLVTAMERCQRLDFDFICEVLSLGLSATSPQLKKKIREDVYASGLFSVLGPCVTFIRVIMNGGKLPRGTAAAEAIDALDTVVAFASADETLAEHIEPLREFGIKLEARLLSLNDAEEAEATSPLAESPSELENSTAD